MCLNCLVLTAPVAKPEGDCLQSWVFNLVENDLGPGALRAAEGEIIFEYVPSRAAAAFRGGPGDTHLTDMSVIGKKGRD
jgi:hypothetical protein